MKKRESRTSRLGFILAAAGSAVGLGNIWRFPYVAGTNGGAIFVVLFLIIVLIIGYPLMVTEITLGRETNKNPIGTFKKLAPDTPWWIVGAMGVLSGFVILSFYSVVSGWGIAYFFKSLGNSFTVDADFEGIFTNHIGSAWAPLLWHGFFMATTALVVGLGIVKGIGRAVKFLMPALFILVIMLALRGVTLEGASEGLSFYLMPRLEDLSWQTLLVASGQAFFSLSLGMGAIITYGSYMNKGDEVPSSAAWIIVLDVLIALLAGFAIFPAVFALGFAPDSGPGLAFITLPAVFASMPFGSFFAAIFFLFLSLAALTSAISLLEVVVSWFVDEKNASRLKATLIMSFLIFLLGIPASLSMGAVDISLLGVSFFNMLDGLQEKVLLPVGGLLTVIFAAYVYKANVTRQKANTGSNKIVLGVWYEYLIKFVIPIAIVIILVAGFIF